MPTEVTTKKIPASYNALACFSREDLRQYAKLLGVERGQNKGDTIVYLLHSGRAFLDASLAVSEPQK